MTIRRSFVASVAAFAAVLATAPPALAAAGLFQTVTAQGVLGVNFADVQSHDPGDGSAFLYSQCITPYLPQQPCVDASTPASAWHQLPALPSFASAQAHTPDYGINRVRTWSRGAQTFDNNTGVAYYSAQANSAWREEITTTSAVPVVITFVVSLHVDWNDGGLWAFQMGRPGEYDSDLGYAEMDGRTWANCSLQPQSGLCRFEYFTGDAQTLLPGGENGSADLIVTLDYIVYPASSANLGDPNALTNTFEAMLGARSYANSAEVLGYSTASLQAILVPPDAGLSFSSGHAYNIQVVPEPATVVLWAFGLAGVVLAARQRAR